MRLPFTTDTALIRTLRLLHARTIIYACGLRLPAPSTSTPTRKV